MDATSFRWVLIVIALIVVAAIYLFGVQQSRLRKRSAIETFTRDEIDSAFIEDEQLRTELNNLNQVLNESDVIDYLDDIQINPGLDVSTTPFVLPDLELFVPEWLKKKGSDGLISYMLRHADFRLLTAEEVSAAADQIGAEVNADGYLEFRVDDECAFQIASLSPPGDFAKLYELDFSTLGLHCFIDLENCELPAQAYEAMLKKVDEMVRLLNVKVYKSPQDLLTISDITDVRKKLK
ncbi:MAG: hypothetical protein ACI8XW_003144 [Gammaproteobacteria bacterium]|jgi:hypothetical protein